MSTLAGRVAIVTGASKGIGAAIALDLAAAGAAVVVNHSASKAAAEQVVADITKAGGRAVAVQADVSKAEDAARLVKQAVETFGPLDILVNNAGVYEMAPLEAVTEQSFHRQFGINVLGALLVTQAAAGRFGQKGGSVINVSSVVTRLDLPGTAVYAGTKAALDSITRVLSAELAPKKVRVNSINPGPVDTEGTRAAGIIGSDFEKFAVAQTPLGRVGQPGDVSRVAVFLAGDDSGWITGENITVAGGMH